MSRSMRALRVVPLTLLLASTSFADDKPLDPEIPKLVDRIQPNLPPPRQPTPPPSTPSSPSRTPEYKPSSSSSSSSSDRSEPEFKMGEKHAWGGYGARAMAGGFTASGTDFARTIPSNPNPNQLYNRAGGYIGLDLTTENTTIFDDAVLLGAELWLNGGVAGGAKYKDGTFRKNDSNEDKKLGFFFRSDALVSLSPLSWGGPLAGRITIFPGVGAVFDPGRYYESYLYLMGGGRLSLVFGGAIAIHGQYAITPFTTNGDYAIMEHRFEGALSYKKLILGFRAQLDSVGEGDVKAVNPSTKSTTNTTLGGFLGVGFK